MNHAMADEFIELANDAKSVADATVYSVRPLTEDETEAISAAFAAKIGKKSLTYYKYYRYQSTWRH